jgi:hypothetical protein
MDRAGVSTPIYRVAKVSTGLIPQPFSIRASIILKN